MVETGLSAYPDRSADEIATIFDQLLLGVTRVLNHPKELG